MHRQSLGSPPSSKLHVNGVLEIQNPFKKIDDEEMSKTQKMKAHKANAQKLVVHLIPLLIFLCIVILFLFSHDPFHKDIVEFDNFEKLPEAMDMKNEEQIPLVVKIGDGGILGLQSKRNLQAYKKVNLKYKLHRKIGN